MLPLQQFISYIKKNALFSLQDKILLAVSGGKDSVLMVQLFKLAEINFSIAHCNFNLRADESQRDEAFVKMLAHTLGVPFYVKHFNTKEYAHENHLSTQMAARELRYSWFEELRHNNDYQYIAVAHHQNDSVETVLLNLTRGTGISGMHGILPKRGAIIRPLLFLTREEIDRLIDVSGLDYVEDSSNSTSKYARNKIRLNVIPELKEINPNLEATFQENINRFSAIEELLALVVEQKFNELAVSRDEGLCFDLAELNKLKPQHLLMYEIFKKFNFSAAVVNEIINSLANQSGTSFYSKTHRATIDRKFLIVSKISNLTQNDTHKLIHINDQDIQFGSNIIGLDFKDEVLINPNNVFAYVPLDLLIFPLVMRYKQDGDRFKPFGMKNFKKLSDFFIDEKIPQPNKDKIPILVNGNGEIIWIVGYRQDNRYKVERTTKKVAIFELLK